MNSYSSNECPRNLPLSSRQALNVMFRKAPGAGSAVIAPAAERSKLRSRPLGQTARIYISTHRTHIARAAAFLFAVGVALVFVERFLQGPLHVVEIDLTGLETHIQPARASPRPPRARKVAVAPRERPPAPNGVHAGRKRPKEFSCGDTASAPKIAFVRVEDGYCDCPVSGADEVHSGACSGAGNAGTGPRRRTP